MGRLLRRLSSGEDRQPASLQDCKGTLPGVVSGSEGEGRTNGSYESNHAGLGWLLSEKSGGGSWRRVVLGRPESGAHDPVSAHARIPESLRSNELSRGREQFAPVERLLLLSRRIHANVVRHLGGR